jgi:hypothetical protein
VLNYAVKWLKLPNNLVTILVECKLYFVNKQIKYWRF